jgi:DNA-binding response OmpR family regulator
MRILIADDDAGVATLVGEVARTLWPACAVALAPDGREALRRFEAESPDMVILDVTMPPPDGFAVCRRIRERDPLVPILMLTGRDALLDEVRALDLGADDFLTKPFDLGALEARLRALARRAGLNGAVPAGTACAAPGGLVVDLAAREARVGGARVDLTATEYELLAALARHRGRFVSPRALLERVWGAEYAHRTSSLKVYIGRLRRKLGDDGGAMRHIENRRGQGYRLLDPPPGGTDAA